MAKVRIALSIAVADGFMPRKVIRRQKGVCQAILPKANEKPLWGCRLAVYLPADTLLRGLGQVLTKTLNNLFTDLIQLTTGAKYSTIFMQHI